MSSCRDLDPAFYVLNEVLKVPCAVGVWLRNDICDFLGLPSSLSGEDFLGIIWALRHDKLVDVFWEDRIFQGEEGEYRQIAATEAELSTTSNEDMRMTLIYGLTSAGGDVLEQYLGSPDWNDYLRVDNLEVFSLNLFFADSLLSDIISKRLSADHICRDHNYNSNYYEELFYISVISGAGDGLLRDVIDSLKSKCSSMVLLPRPQDFRIVTPWPATYWKQFARGASTVIGVSSDGLQHDLLPARVWPKACI